MIQKFLTLLLLFACSPIVVAAEVDDFVKDVLRAHAKDIPTLKKQSVSIVKASGKMLLNGESFTSIRTVQSNWPSQSVAHFEYGKESGFSSMMLCVLNDRGWKRISGSPSVDLTLEEVSDCRQGTYALWMQTLLPLLESGNKIVFTPGIRVSGEAMTSITVTRRNWPDVTLSFDPNTNLLRRLAYKAREVAVLKSFEMILSDYKEFEGLKLPNQILFKMDGKDLFDWNKVEYAFPEKLDRTIFEKP